MISFKKKITNLSDCQISQDIVNIIETQENIINSLYKKIKVLENKVSYLEEHGPKNHYGMGK